MSKFSKINQAGWHGDLDGGYVYLNLTKGFYADANSISMSIAYYNGDGNKLFEVWECDDGGDVLPSKIDKLALFGCLEHGFLPEFIVNAIRIYKEDTADVRA